MDHLHGLQDVSGNACFSREGENRLPVIMTALHKDAIFVTRVSSLTSFSSFVTRISAIVFLLPTRFPRCTCSYLETFALTYRLTDTNDRKESRVIFGARIV